MRSWDVIIAGAGIIGVSLALELRQRGATVLVIDRAEPGSEASSAAAGMLAPSDPETPAALRPLAKASARMFAAFVQKVESAAGMQTDFRRVGTIALMPENTTVREYRGLSAAELQRLEPSIHRSGYSAYFVQEDSVDPLLLTRAALAAARTLGVEVRGHSAVTEIRARGEAVEVETQADTFFATAAVDCRGAWSGAPVRPRKGQMLYVYPETSVLQHVLRAPDVYIVPRSSGKILIGATVEDVGFDKSVDVSAIQQLLTAAVKYLPALAICSCHPKLGRIAPRHAGRSAYPRPNRDTTRLRRDRSLPQRHPSCPDYGTNHSRSDLWSTLTSGHQRLLAHRFSSTRK